MTKEKSNGQRAPNVIQKLLDYDVVLSKNFVEYALRFKELKTLKTNGTYLDLSCNGIVWFPMWIAFIWVLNKKELYEMQMNMLVGLLIDVIIVALLKAYIRRRRPTNGPSLLTIGPDKFSFPSGHASRAFFIFMFFVFLWPISKLFWLPLLAWATCVAVSRILLRRHYILDVFSGVLVASFVSCLLSLIWMNSDTASGFINFLSSDNLPDGVGDE